MILLGLLSVMWLSFRLCTKYWEEENEYRKEHEYEKDMWDC